MPLRKRMTIAECKSVTNRLRHEATTKTMIESSAKGRRPYCVRTLNSAMENVA